MDTLFGSEYWLARFLFQKGLAAIYFIAFLTALNQFRPLLGENGLLPVPRFLRSVNFNQAPSVFHLHYCDEFLLFIVCAGIALSSAILIGLPELGMWWIPAIVWSLIWIFYLSIVNVGQIFYAFGWESMLLEAGFLAIFMGSQRTAVPLLIIFLVRWMLFRVEFGAGLIKIRGDKCWRDLTCLNYHHETQPMPNPLSWYFHHLPPWMHKLEVIGNHFFQLIAPWGLFFPQPIASIAAGLIIISQLWLVLSGNFSWLNWLVIVLALPSFGNTQLRTILPINPPPVSQSTVHQWFVFAATFLIIILSWWPIRNLLSKRQLMNASFNPYHIVNTYGAFGSVTKKRYEIIIEGTCNSSVTTYTTWLEYEFKGKPGNINRRPPQFAPYHLRLDWLMWFLPFNLRFNAEGKTQGPYYYREWFLKLIEKLLYNDRAILKLLRNNPFPDSPPCFIRARVYLYKFTSPQERKKTGAWWRRELVGEYLPPITLQDIQEVKRSL